MRLHYWTYEGPSHVGGCRVGTAIDDVHTVLYAPGGDSYTTVLFTMIERQCGFPAVTNVSYGRREVSNTGIDRLLETVQSVVAHKKPRVVQVIPTCTSNLLREDVGGALRRLQPNVDAKLVYLQLNAFTEKENQGADMTFAGLVEALATGTGERTPTPSVNILGGTRLGFRNRDDLRELRRLLADCGVQVNVCLPLGGTAEDFDKLGQAWFNIVPYMEIGPRAARILQERFNQPFLRKTPIGVQATQEFIADVQRMVDELGGPAPKFKPRPEDYCNLPWYSRSADSHYLTPKRSFVFGDASHSLAIARMMQEEIGMRPLAVGTYTYEHREAFLAECEAQGWNGFYSDDYTQVEKKVGDLLPDMVLGTQMERHSARRHDVPATVISCPAHVTDFPARYSPFVGWEGSNVIFDNVTHTLTLGLESHLIEMFRELPGVDSDPVLGARRLPEAPMAVPANPVHVEAGAPAVAVVTPVVPKDFKPVWSPAAEAELKKIPFFVRKKAIHNTEKYAIDNGIREITPQTIHDTRDALSKK